MKKVFLIFTSGVLTSFSSFADYQKTGLIIPDVSGQNGGQEQMFDRIGSRGDQTQKNVKIQKILCSDYVSSQEAFEICMRDNHFNHGRFSSCVFYASDIVSQAICLKNSSLTPEIIAKCSISTPTYLQDQICLLGKVPEDFSSLNDLKVAIEKFIGFSVSWNSEGHFFEFPKRAFHSDDNDRDQHDVEDPSTFPMGTGTSRYSI